MQQTQARVNLYALLSRILLQELEVTTLEMIKNDTTILDFFPTLKEWKPLSEVPAKKLLDEYINPDFVNLSLLHLIPYETFYVREDQMIETGGANPVTDIYSAYDFMVDFEVARTVSSDHIGIELEFMHHLCVAESKALQEGDSEAVKELQEVQKEFLNKHLLVWAPLYLINMKYEARTPLYYDAAEMCLEFILSDNEYLLAQLTA
ncbi:MAG: dehydrogenase [Epsilonproteobacteria bacterium]|nr:dehydrogenase [Campylobacterota bacterium]PIP11167.1 MAG: dehydrogenase [Sulfurimonas sp. CG23_combo_of_CG06-09_8_20_14_all_36_33]PIS24915.1 MAG: dehydrogenase [Sulfurimonas sp. CG08_land_8_20_14_0_20_36_33]PIU34668.1 MAG: dehydrogenase [Sulfurimonas sp. CG07_land_8_20_14_0_80_36_56]PIV05083.1 MAG: dehydrogenase [Sulfurimonas sp. CG03_land_8_20_14_0_80_36_25]PIV35320.1 MAG: dehydrogenase [Sulfurimonas sp. CG02_land_8_20_14_3_00_36_67]PIV59881.1 MAG: dehydrogenase [Sulfurimonas sp. CG01_lan